MEEHLSVANMLTRIHRVVDVIMFALSRCTAAATTTTGHPPGPSHPRPASSGADDLLPCVIYSVLRAQLRHLPSTLLFLERHVHRDEMMARCARSLGVLGRARASPPRSSPPRRICAAVPPPSQGRLRHRRAAVRAGVPADRHCRAAWHERWRLRRSSRHVRGAAPARRRRTPTRRRRRDSGSGRNQRGEREHSTLDPAGVAHGCRSPHKAAPQGLRQSGRTRRVWAHALPGSSGCAGHSAQRGAAASR